MENSTNYGVATIKKEERVTKEEFNVKYAFEEEVRGGFNRIYFDNLDALADFADLLNCRRFSCI